MDIRMPFMDGLELIKAVKEKNSGICVIIISGHEEFSYAKTALQYDAFDYVLKPINLDDLKMVIKKAHTHLEHRKMMNREMDEIRLQIKENTPVLKERFILDIIFGRLSTDRVFNKAESFDLRADSFFAAALIEIDDDGLLPCLPPDNQKQLEIYFFDTLNSSPKTFVSTISYKEYLLVASGGSREPVQSLLDETAEAVFKEGHEADLSLTVSTGPVVSGIENLQSSYEAALWTSRGKFTAGCNRILYYDTSQQSSSIDNIDMYDISEFKKALTFSDREASLSELKNLQTRIQNQDNPSQLAIQLLCLNIFFECKRVIQERGAEIIDIIANPFKVLQTILEQPSRESMFDTLWLFVEKILNYHDEIRLNQYSCDTDKAKHFIKNNFQDAALNLKSIADHVNVSPCHFSVIFKKKTGQTYIQYLTDTRINKAKELLLNSDMKVYEVSYEVGYENPTYFSTLFKKITGIAPFDYKKQILSPPPGKAYHS